MCGCVDSLAHKITTQKLKLLITDNNKPISNEKANYTYTFSSF